MNDKKYAIFSIVFLLFLSMLVMFKQLQSHNYFSSFMSDTYQNTSWASQFIDALKEGMIYPRWTPLNFWGYGNPTFILYPPLAFYMVAMFHIFSNSLIFAIKLAKTFSIFVSACGIFFLVREIYDAKIALISGVIYILFPFYVFDTYVGGFCASSISSTWFPLIMFFIIRYMKKNEYLYLLYAGVCYGGLILTHLINAYMFTFVMIAFIICASISERKPKYLFTIPIIVVTGLAISSAYVLPFMYEKHFFTYNAEMELFPVQYLFILPKHTNNFPPDFFWRSLYDKFLGYVILFFVITILVLYQIMRSTNVKIKKEITIFNGFLVGVSLSSLFMLFGPSIFLFETIPFFKFIFPVRWLIITAFAVVLLFSFFIYILETLSASKFRRYSLLVVILLMWLFLDYRYINSAHTFDQQDLVPAKGTNWVSWFLPKGIDVNRLDKDDGLKEKVVIAKGEGDYEVVKWESANRIVDITAYKPIPVRIRTFNFPGWTAYIDGMKTEIQTENDTGAILIDIPKGRHILMLEFADTPIVYYSKLISLVSFSGIIILFIFKKMGIYGTRMATSQ